MEVCNCSMFCCTLLYVLSSIAIILMGKRKLVVLLNLSSWCLVVIERLFLAVPRGCLRFAIVVFPDHNDFLFLISKFQVGFKSLLCQGLSEPEFYGDLCWLCLCARLFICALWSPAGKGLTSWLSFVLSSVSLSLSHWYPESGVVLDCIDS